MTAAEEFLRRLRFGGQIVSSSFCSALEIAEARAYRRFFVDGDGHGYVYRRIESEARELVGKTVAMRGGRQGRILSVREQDRKLVAGVELDGGEIITIDVREDILAFRRQHKISG
jgi:hypothetical protein